jgi:hypothetical protein
VAGINLWNITVGTDQNQWQQWNETKADALGQGQRLNPEATHGNTSEETEEIPAV